MGVAPVVLTILDGWGHRNDSEHNAIRQGDTPVMEALWHAYPHTLIQASGSHVGLPDQQMGNSEVVETRLGVPMFYAYQISVELTPMLHVTNVRIHIVHV